MIRTWLVFVAAAFSLTLTAQEAPPAPTKKKRATVPTPAVKVEPVKVETPKAETVGNQGPVLKFNTDSGTPVNTDHRDMIKFKGIDAPANELPQPIAESISTEEEGFKTYLGYPKHQVALINNYGTLSATWGYNGQDFTFNTSTMAYGLAYRFVATPAVQLELAYSRYNVGVDSGTASGYRIQQSDEDVDQYGLRGQYCHISSANFFRQYCLGGFVGNDAYPVLKFIDSVNLKMGKVQDITVGVHAGIQLPFTDTVYFRSMLAFNYGTGAGNQGSLTPTNDTTLALNVAVPWQATRRHEFKPHVDFIARQATLEGKIGNNKDKWQTDSTTFGGGLDYTFTF